jgi:hypothetical protein
MDGNLLFSNRVSDIFIFMLFRYCEGGELFNYIIQKKTLSEKEAATIMK